MRENQCEHGHQLCSKCWNLKPAGAARGAPTEEPTPLQLVEQMLSVSDCYASTHEALEALAERLRAHGKERGE